MSCAYCKCRKALHIVNVSSLKHPRYSNPCDRPSRSRVKPLHCSKPQSAQGLKDQMIQEYQRSNDKNTATIRNMSQFSQPISGWWLFALAL